MLGLSLPDSLAFILVSVSLFIYFCWRLVVRTCWLTNRNQRPVVITGCDTGFGRVLALRLISLEVPCIATCLFEKSCLELTEIYERSAKRDTNGNDIFMALQMDVRDDESVAKVVQKVRHSYTEGIWALVCNAGVLGKPCPDDWLIPKDFTDVLEVNLVGSIRCVQAFKPLIRQMQGRIILTGSITMRIGLPGIAPYTVSKFGIEGYAQTLRHEIRPQKIDVIVIEPGFHGTSLSSSDVIKKGIDQCWDRLSPYYKELYGEGYEQKMFNSIVVGLLGKNCNDLSGILDSFQHAILAKFPDYRYRVGVDAWTQFYPLSLMPDKLQDLAIDAWYYLLNVPYPEYTYNL